MGDDFIGGIDKLNVELWRIANKAYRWFYNRLSFTVSAITTLAKIE